MTPPGLEARLTPSTPLRVCLLAAGSGTRSAGFKGLHKALLPLGNRAVISRIIDTFPENTEFVIALGSKASQLKAFIQRMHPGLLVKYVNVSNFDGIGSGPGRSLLDCEPFLGDSFVFTSIDTVIDPIEEFPSGNWVGVAKPASRSRYCVVSSDKDSNVLEMRHGFGDQAFVGIAGVVDASVFWSGIRNATMYNSEIQVIDGLNALVDHGLKALSVMGWNDTGNADGYALATKAWSTNRIVEPKNDEATYIDGMTVIKAFADPSRATKRVMRSRGRLTGLVPACDVLCDGMYAYDYIPGMLLSDPRMDSSNEFWKFCERMFSRVECDRVAFENDCNTMYREKTLARVKKMCDERMGGAATINERLCPSVSDLVSRIDWTTMSHTALPYYFHGDFQPENIIWTGDRFVLLDWRENFGDSLEIGDIYYDFAKLHHALLVNGSVVRAGQYDVIEDANHVNVSIKHPAHLLQLVDEFENFVTKHGYSWKHVLLVSALTLVNIAPVHAGRYRDFLVRYGQLKLAEALEIVDA